VPSLGTLAERAGRELEWAGFRGLVALGRSVPEAAVPGLAERLGRSAFALGGRRAAHALANLRICFPERSDAERIEIAARSYVHTAWNALDLLRAAGWSCEEVRRRVTIEGVEHQRAAVAAGRGAFLLVPHLGNFELAGLASPLWGMDVTWMARPQRNPHIEAWVERLRTRTGAQVVGKRHVIPDVLRTLRAGGTVGVLNDQYTVRARSVFVPFFGVRCSTGAGLAALVLRSGAAVLPAYVARDGRSHHTARIGRPLEFEISGDRRRDLHAVTAACNRAYEAMIRLHPEQYWWTTRRFRHSPDLPANPYR
jgi:KDO2-lipid IV(A) lauroyltransferase